MTQRIHMRMGKAMIADRIGILGKDAAVILMHPEAVLKRKLIINVGLFIQVKGQRNRDALGHQPGPPDARFSGVIRLSVPSHRPLPSVPNLRV